MKNKRKQSQTKFNQKQAFLFMDITKEQFESFLQSHTFPLSPNQNKLSYPKLLRIFKRMVNNKPFTAIKVGEEKIIDGHHRYVCAEFLSKDLETTEGGVNISHEVDLSWKEILIEDEDWDHEEDLKAYTDEFD